MCSSKCFGKPTPDIKQWLFDEGFDEVLYLPFEDESNLSVYFYVREDDHRARIVCKVRRTSRASEYFCLPLNMLEVERVGSCLQLCRRRRAGMELVPWLNLKFYTIEKMVTFFCTFLALRSQDSHKPVEEIRDYELEDEEEMFGGYVIILSCRVYTYSCRRCISTVLSSTAAISMRSAFTETTVPGPYDYRPLSMRARGREPLSGRPSSRTKSAHQHGFAVPVPRFSTCGSCVALFSVPNIRLHDRLGGSISSSLPVVRVSHAYAGVLLHRPQYHYRSRAIFANGRMMLMMSQTPTISSKPSMNSPPVKNIPPTTHIFYFHRSFSSLPQRINNLTGLDRKASSTIYILSRLCSLYWGGRR
ncbi:hypothetical protein VTN77DRAFT_1852 [Rasamsonia byssochlamydoides]|uniref:uncharacterized protein n=1 Tax=Rasamsonia byssochlamydoides TaxID=89139 RepID=UPI00374205B8